MQCVNCQFENMPGLTVCARCQSVLQFGEVTVLPPRASRWRLATWATRRVHAASQMVRALGRSLGRALPRWPRMPRTFVPWGAVFRSIVPGLGHIKLGQKRTGRLLLACWGAMLVLAVLLLGLTWSPRCLVAAEIVHVVAIVSLLGAQLSLHGTVLRTCCGLGLFLGLRSFVYQPVCGLGELFFVPLELSGLNAGEAVQNGDVLLYQGRWMRDETFARGDIVVYDISGEAQVGYVVQGIGLDRIVGVPGDRIHMRDGAIWINDRLMTSTMHPLGEANIRLASDTIELAKSEFLIFPSRFELTMYGNVNAPSFIERLSRVQGSEIVGRVVFRTHPWSRFALVE